MIFRSFKSSLYSKKVKVENLRLSNLKARDSGTYECMSDNTAGTSTDTVKLQVQAKMELDPPKLPKASIIKTQDVRELKAGLFLYL